MWPLPLEWVDASGIESSSTRDCCCPPRRRRTRRLLLDGAPLMRLTVVRPGPLTHYLIWTHHHLILDGWSMSLGTSEIVAEIEGRSTDRLQVIADASPKPG